MDATPRPQAGAVKLTMLLAGIVFALMMLFGLIMRAAQGDWLELDPALFYQILTAHGAGMVGSAALSGAAILWYFVGRHVPLSAAIFWTFLALFLLGVVFILGAIFIGGYGGAWTFLFPLPAISGGAWGAGAAAFFILGYTAIGVGFLLFHLEVGRRIASAYGGLGRALGWGVISDGNADKAPPPTIVAAAAVTVFNTIGIVSGAAILVASLVHLLVPGFEVDALLAKNLIFFFGHVFINASIYMAVTAVYEIIPEYTGRPWKDDAGLRDLLERRARLRDGGLLAPSAPGHGDARLDAGDRPDRLLLQRHSVAGGDGLLALRLHPGIGPCVGTWSPRCLCSRWPAGRSARCRRRSTA